MKKQHFKSSDSTFTYLLERACKHCGAPIPDDAHKTREFCPESYNPITGKVRDCKSDFHRSNDEEDRKKTCGNKSPKPCYLYTN